VGRGARSTDTLDASPSGSPVYSHFIGSHLGVNALAEVRRSPLAIGRLVSRRSANPYEQAESGSRHDARPR
jgi:hypothetical protein